MRLSTHENPAERRLRMNPIELLILSMVCSGFGLSVYNVFKESDQFRFAALDSRQADPTRSARSPASLSGGAPLEVPCSQNPGFNLNGQQCPAKEGSEKPLKLRPEGN